ncbi:MAG TPA: Xaa-Pro peptidase family protein [Syntrophorhabdaceae bacterium]|nr:Xaa-Pro peptidase family protein [Syntrophorhabdaceae bacterium]HQM80979.1 Xaa-Pro peptidase family protein [Syntrophorhabdaceae bacterium]
MRDNRVAAVLNIIEDMDLDACVLRGMENIFYLTGYRGSEGTLVVTRKGLFLLTDFRYITYAREATKGIEVVEIKLLKHGLLELCKKQGIKKMGFDSFHTTFNIYQIWKDTLQDILFVPLGNRIEEIRKYKDQEEIESINEAVRIATGAYLEVLARLRPGKTEKEVANDLDFTMRRFGANCPSFDTIVASGPRAALPHAEPTDKVIVEGETVIIDFGAQVNGYCSDETCTISLGRTNGKMEEAFSVVNNARMLALANIKVGLSIREFDGMVRGFIKDAGYGDFFGHGVGHGVGIAVHEAPAINSSSEGVFEENMVVTIEPGIYIPDLGGVRLEDMVHLTAHEAKIMTKIRKDTLRRI